MTQYREALRELDPSTLNQRAVSEALLLGQAVSAVKCTGIGTTSAVSRDKVLRLLKDQGEKVRSSQLVRTLS
jgi:hypothetical protein